MESNTTLTFQKIYEEESDAIFRFCLTRVSNREQALDLVQETFLRLWQTLSLEKEVLNNRAFLFTVAHRLVIDWYRKKKSVSLDAMMHKEGEADFDVADETTTKENIEAGAEGRQLLEALDALPESYRQPLYLRFVEGMLPQDIAKILGISANAASVRINRGMLELRKRTGYDTEEV
ncbi:MAG: RNA polymerase sigma factor [bacterium]